MRYQILAEVVTIAALTLVAGCVSTDSSSVRDGSFDVFQCRFTGHWDNARQANADVAAGADFANRHPRRAMRYVPIGNDHLDGRLFAIHNYGETGFDGPLTRVSLHRFRPVGDHIVHEFLFLKDKNRWGDLSNDLTVLSQITLNDVRINSNCSMTWRWTGDHFAGGTTPGRCVTRSFTPEPILIEGHGELWPDRIVRHDANFTTEGEPLPVAGGATPELFDRTDSTGLGAIACMPWE